MHACVISRMGVNRRLEERREGSTPTLSLCLAWIPILCGINRCFKAKKRKKKCWLSSRIFRHFSLLHWECRFCAFYFSIFSLWCELHSGQGSICRCPRISLLKTPLSAVGMSCKVQAVSGSGRVSLAISLPAPRLSARPLTHTTVKTIYFLPLFTLCKLTLTFNANPSCVIFISISHHTKRVMTDILSFVLST